MLDDEELAAIAELKAMTKDELQLVEHKEMYWPCHAFGCENCTKIKDYGISPEFFTRWGWLNLERYTYECGKHYKQSKSGIEFLSKSEAAVNYIRSEK